MIRPMSLALILSAASLLGCGQGVGDRCQQNSDCQDELICAIPPDKTPQIGGVCQSTIGVDLATGYDFAAPADLARHD